MFQLIGTTLLSYSAIVVVPHYSVVRGTETKITGPDDRGGRRGYSLNRDCVNGRVNEIP
ncbi:hypothetical protein J6590_078394 [Homalodisca vitripennis]|nr:hypothetical protein J6590_078394 [Homalodisca vitripennis]